MSSALFVIPVKTGIQEVENLNRMIHLDSGFRRSDGFSKIYRPDG